MSHLNYYNLISEPRQDDDFINNSESDISEASEIYPLLSNVSFDQENYIVYKFPQNCYNCEKFQIEYLKL